MTQRKWYYCLPAKVTAVFLTAALFFGGLVLAGGAGLSILIAGAEGTTEMAQREVAEYFLSLYDWEIARDFVLTGTVDEVYEDMPFSYVITYRDGTVLAATYDGGDYLAYSVDVYSYFDQFEKDETGRVSATLFCPAADTLTGDSWLEVGVRVVTWWHTHRWWCMGLGGACWVLMLVCFVFLCSVAGHHNGTDGPVCNPIDRIPFDVYAVLYGLVGFGAVYVAAQTSGGIVTLVFVAVMGLVLLGLLFNFVLSIVTRVKTRTLWRNTLIGRVLRWLIAGCRAVGRHLPALWQVLLSVVAISLLELALFWVNMWEPDNLLLLWLFEKLLLVPLIVLLALGLIRVQKGIRRIAAGQVEHQIDTRRLPGALRTAAEDVNHIGDGLSDAVEQRLRSERFKTELITNVSHDLKTPLTSIINYVDLMEKQNPEDPVLREYLEVLSRQSARLKKLVEDLLEASKASTGNLPVALEPCQMGVLLEQVMGEYAEKAQAADLTLLLHRPEVPVTVLADGRLLWRVLDNLLGNICKYAMPGTRVYVDLTAIGGESHVVFRNVSRTPLHMDSEELLERFVRGDSARHTEGSGLGLSIARSLMELQGGALSLTVDGDLFKVELTLPMTK
ncbi:MAG: HAMP domain-containing histidine kinase [Clostridia bacterium]|nr:HAMP domain-containing histidine kinase [Clostridia bacterium]